VEAVYVPWSFTKYSEILRTVPNPSHRHQHPTIIATPAGFDTANTIPSIFTIQPIHQQVNGDIAVALYPK